MDTVVLAAVVASAFLHAAWNAILKREPDPVSSGAGVFAVSFVTAVVAAAIEGKGFAGTASVLWSVGAGLFEAGYMISLSRSLAHAPLGAVYTVSRGGALVGVWPLSIALLGERLTAPGLAGVSIVLVGLVLTGFGEDKKLGKTDARGLWWAVASAANIAGYHLCYKEALADGGGPSAVFAVAIGVSVPFLLERIGAAGRKTLAETFRRRPWPVVVAGVLCCASFLIFLVGLARAGAGAVLTLRNTSVLFAQILGLALGERPTRARLAGGLAVAAGAVLLGWPT